MGLVDLILLACSLASPTTCDERHVLFASPGSLHNCMMQAQPYLARWVNEHPAFRVARWRCEWPDQEGGKI